MPISSFERSGMNFQLIHQPFDRKLIFFFSGLLVKGKKKFARYDLVYVICFSFIEMDIAMFFDARSGPSLHIIEIPLVGGFLPHLEHSQAAESLPVAEVQAFAMINLPSFREAF